jgi:hypothetical protein
MTSVQKWGKLPIEFPFDNHLLVFITQKKIVLGNGMDIEGGLELGLGEHGQQLP